MPPRPVTSHGDIVIEQASAHRIEALAGILAGFFWPGERSFNRLTMAQQKAAKHAAWLALSYLHEGMNVAHAEAPFQVMENGEQIKIASYQADTLKYLGIAYKCEYCGPGANVWHLHPGHTMDEVRKVISYG